MPNKTQQRRRRAASSNSKKMTLTNPPPITAYPAFRKTFRFLVGNGVTNQPVIGYDLLGLLAVATSPSGATSILSAVKIHSCSIWVSNVANATAFPDVFWTGSYAKTQKTIDISTGSSVPAHVRSVPPVGSDAAMWCSYQTGAATKLTLTCPANSVVDLDCSVIMTNFGVNPVVGYTSTGLTAGGVFFGPLDHNTGVPKIIPLDVTYYG